MWLYCCEWYYIWPYCCDTCNCTVVSDITCDRTVVIHVTVLLWCSWWRWNLSHLWDCDPVRRDARQGECNGAGDWWSLEKNLRFLARHNEDTGMLSNCKIASCRICVTGALFCELCCFIIRKRKILYIISCWSSLELVLHPCRLAQVDLSVMLFCVSAVNTISQSVSQFINQSINSGAIVLSLMKVVDNPVNCGTVWHSVCCVLIVWFPD